MNTPIWYEAFGRLKGEEGIIVRVALDQPAKEIPDEMHNGVLHVAIHCYGDDTEDMNFYVSGTNKDGVGHAAMNVLGMFRSIKDGGIGRIWRGV